MPRLIFLTCTVILSLATLARSDDKYLLRENVDVGRKTRFEVITDDTYKDSTKVDGKQGDQTNRHRHNILKGTITVLEVKDGSATAIKVDVDPDSTQSVVEDNKPNVKIPSPFAGKTITLRRRADGSVGTDYKGDADKDQLHDFGSLLDPDQDNFSDKPVAVGDSWEISDQLSKRLDLAPKDQVLANCRLDAVKTVDGKQIAEISVSAAYVTFEDFVENDIELSGSIKVDMANGQVIHGELKGPMKISGTSTITDKDTGTKQKIEVSGSGDVSEITNNTPATKPSK